MPVIQRFDVAGSGRDHGSVAGPTDGVSQGGALHVNSNKAIDLLEKAGTTLFQDILARAAGENAGNIISCVRMRFLVFQFF
jgi:hypothetical protein